MKHAVISVADWNISIYSTMPFELEKGYQPFIIYSSEDTYSDFTSLSPKCTIYVEVVPHLPLNIFKNKLPVFVAENSYLRFYSIYQFQNGLGYVVYDQQFPFEIQQIAVATTDFLNWTVYCAANRGVLYPLKYPFGPILFHYLTLSSDACMIHASCIRDGNKGRLFSGFSGTGKSTIAKLWANDGSSVINDDRLIIRRIDNKYKVFNTPMFYLDSPKVTSLDSIFLIRHSSGNKLKRISGAKAVSRVMACCIQNNFDNQFVKSRLDFLSDLITDIPVYELGFVPDSSVLKFIRQLESDNYNTYETAYTT